MSLCSTQPPEHRVLAQSTIGVLFDFHLMQKNMIKRWHILALLVGVGLILFGLAEHFGWQVLPSGAEDKSQ